MATLMSSPNGISQRPGVQSDQSSSLQPTTRGKLTGRAFYESLGSPKMILAPMVDQSEFAWRMLTRSFMPPGSSKDLLAYTPMIHSRLFAQTVQYRNHSFQPTRSGMVSPPSLESVSAPSDIYLDGNPSVDRPLIVQFCANSPDYLLEAARYVAPYCDAVDLNLGCPQGIARKGHYGAFLQEDWKLVYELINTLHKNLDVPVTAKMRILETREKTLEYAKVILSAGASVLTVHGRLRDQKGHKTGLADWSVLRYLRENLPPETVIFANGNILQYGDIDRCLRETGADGVMSAEGNLHDPAIFAKAPAMGDEDREYWRGRDGKGGYRMDAVFRRYMDIIYQYVLETPLPKRKPLFLPSDSPAEAALELGGCFNEVGARPAKKLKCANPAGQVGIPTDGTATASQRATNEDKPKKKHIKCTSPNLLSIQAHLFSLLRPLVTQHTHIRDALAHSRAGDIPAFENVLSLVEAAVEQGLLDHATDPAKYEDPPPNLATEQKTASDDDEDDRLGSSVAAVRACKKPWWVCQPYVRPLPKEALEKGSWALGKKARRKVEEEEVKVKVMMGVGVGVKGGKRASDGNGAGPPRGEMPREGVVCG